MPPPRPLWTDINARWAGRLIDRDPCDTEGSSTVLAMRPIDRRPRERGEGSMKLLIADDRLTIEGIRRALEGAEGIEVVGETYSGAEVLPLVERTKPDMLLLDLRMPGL